MNDEADADGTDDCAEHYSPGYYQKEIWAEDAVGLGDGGDEKADLAACNHCGAEDGGWVEGFWFGERR